MNNFKYFTVAFVMSLLIIVPVFALAGAYQYARAVPVVDNQTGVVVATPTANDAKNILLVTTGDEIGFMLLRFDALQKKVITLSLSPQLIVKDQSTAMQALGYAGPAHVMTCVEELLGIKIDYFYYLSEEQLMHLCINMTGTTAGTDIAKQLPQLSGIEIETETARKMIAKEKGRQKQLLRAVLYSLLLESNSQKLDAELPNKMRAISNDVKSNIGAVDIYSLTKIWNLNKTQKINYYAATLWGEETEEGITLSKEDSEKAKKLLE